ncbi:MAG: ABC transporter substrate-binding protein [Oscillospiraceae bacterium]|nr:ABC transporter substrate-binding protein [Oscillospiraceae bacterium]
MKKHIKKMAAFALAALFCVLCFSACGAENSSQPESQNSAPGAAGDGTLRIGVVQYMQHPSLDEICAAFQNEMEMLSGGSVIIEVKNAQGEMSNVNSICQNFAGQGMDMIVAIATPAAQGAVATAPEIPVVFSAVTDPVDAGLMSDLQKPDGNATGTSDAIPVDRIFDLAKELTPDAKNFGLIYNASEPNSLSVIAQTKTYLEANGYTYQEVTVNNSSEVAQAAQSMVGKNVDAVFVPIDNTVASGMRVLADTATEAGIPVYVAADSMVADGGLATVGVNYTQLGKQTAQMAYDALNGKAIADMPVQVLNEYAVAVNSETAAALGIDVSAYEK